MNNDELYHYGILGMRWGRRKGPNITDQGGRRVKGKNTQQSTGNKKASQDRSDKIKKGLLIAGVALTLIGGLKLRNYLKNRNSSASNVINSGVKIVERNKNLKLSSIIPKLHS